MNCISHCSPVQFARIGGISKYTYFGDTEATPSITIKKLNQMCNGPLTTDNGRHRLTQIGQKNSPQCLKGIGKELFDWPGFAQLP